MNIKKRVLLYVILHVFNLFVCIKPGYYVAQITGVWGIAGLLVVCLGLAFLIKNMWDLTKNNVGDVKHTIQEFFMFPQFTAAIHYLKFIKNNYHG